MGIVRNIAGVVAGIVVSQAVVIAVEALNTYVYPPPGDFATYDTAQIADWVMHAPPAAMVLVVVGWALAAFAGPWVALRVADRQWAGYVVSAMFFAACVMNLFDLPHPFWMGVCAVVLPVLGGWLAQRLHRKPYPGEPLLG